MFVYLRNFYYISCFLSCNLNYHAIHISFLSVFTYHIMSQHIWYLSTIYVILRNLFSFTGLLQCKCVGEKTHNYLQKSRKFYFGSPLLHIFIICLWHWRHVCSQFSSMLQTYIFFREEKIHVHTPPPILNLEMVPMRNSYQGNAVILTISPHRDTHS